MQSMILDDLSRQLGDDATRRGFVRRLGSIAALGALGAVGASTLSESATAKRRRKKKGKNQAQQQVCPPGTLVAQLNVGGNGAIVQTPVLTQGQAYTFQASGAAALSSVFSFDADFIFANADPSTGVDVDSGIDAGLSIDDPTVDANKSPKWGAYNPNHVYETQFVGKGAPAQLRMHDGNFTDNSGSVLVTITCA
jgi:hypothetical protein